MHPLCSDNVSGIMLDNCVTYDDLLESFEESDIAYSFFSTSLFDAQIFGLKTISIILPSSKIDKTSFLQVVMQFMIYDYISLGVNSCTVASSVRVHFEIPFNGLDW